jgi:4-hydroxybenzoate polyprenyltransferase
MSAIQQKVVSAGILATLWGSLTAFLTDIKLAHSIFALPFAVVGFLIGGSPFPGVSKVFLAVGGMVTARTFAMGMNRFLDHKLDGQNPRTSGRSIPSGRLGPLAALCWSLLAGVFFVAISFGLSPLAGWLSVPLLMILAFYSLMKRISWLTHWYLGFCLGLAPVAVNVAFGGSVSVPVGLVGAAVMFWTAGFDIIYSLQDRSFDAEKGLRSIPAAFGPAKALFLSRLSFLAMILCLMAVGMMVSAGNLYFAGVVVVAGILLFEQFIVRDIVSSPGAVRIETAFFTANAWVSVLFYCFVQWDYLIR